MAKLGGFWSYAHADDDADFGGITNLGRDIVAQYEMLTGEPIELFLDRDSLEWGDAWTSKVDGSLASVAFFIPVMTPRFFQSTECRRELRFFVTQANKLSLNELIMPLLYVDFPGHHEEDPTDELIALVKKYQWEFWTDLRLVERGSGEYRKAVVALAKRLVAANAAIAAAASVAPIPAADDDDDDDDAPGIMDRMAEAETALPAWTDTAARVGQIIQVLGSRMQAAGEEMQAADARGKGFAGRLTVARRLADELKAPGEEVLSLSSDFAEQMNTVDSGIRAIIEAAPDSSANSPEEQEAIQEFFDSIIEMATSADEGLGSIEAFLNQMSPIERMSRDLRAPLKKFRQGLTVMSEGRQVINGWVRLIEESPARREN